MGSTKSLVMAAVAAQILGQAIAGWSLLAHLADWSNASVWVAGPLIAAIAVPFRHDGSLSDRAAGNFGAAIVVSGLLMWEIALGGLDGIAGGGGFAVGLVATLMLIATVLFVTAGAFFWVLREGRAA